jgi:hypothetical protein
MVRCTQSVDVRRRCVRRFEQLGSGHAPPIQDSVEGGMGERRRDALGGRIAEQWGGDGGVVHAAVSFVARPTSPPARVVSRNLAEPAAEMLNIRVHSKVKASFGFVGAPRLHDDHAHR